MKTLRLLLPLIACFALSTPCFADKVCLKSVIRSGKVRVVKRAIPSTEQCARGFTELFDSSALQTIQVGPQGPQGVEGPQGLPGELRVYGNGSAGVLSVTTARNLASDPLPGNNLQFSDCSINSGVTLTINSGTILRCSGTFDNQGTILVLPGALGGSFRAIGNGADNLSALDMGYRDPSQGHIAASQAQTGSRGDSSQTRGGGFGGTGGMSQISGTLNPISKIWLGHFGGSGGAGSRPNSGGAGGGAFYVFAGGAILNSGEIRAHGNNGGIGCGGGGGGIVVLASKTSVTNTGLISVRGGGGGNGADNGVFAGLPSGFGFGPGGSGGGGLVVFASPIVSPGATDVTPGAVGTGATITAASVLRIGGGGGGASAGSGGTGASVFPSGNTGAGDGGQNGLAVTIEADPSALY